VLRNPAHWDDTNDSYFLELYKAEMGARSIVAACFTRATETYHHWRVFTPASEGICIEIDRAQLTASLKNSDHCAVGAVEYLLVRELAEFQRKDLPRLPFVKRVGYKDEREWRIISLLDDATAVALPISLEPAWIRRIILNPWIHSSLSDNLREMVRKIEGCSDLSIEISQLTNSKRWKSAGKKVLRISK
jgi:hypothetical protein